MMHRKVKWQFATTKIDRTLQVLQTESHPAPMIPHGPWSLQWRRTGFVAHRVRCSNQIPSTAVCTAVQCLLPLPTDLWCGIQLSETHSAVCAAWFVLSVVSEKPRICIRRENSLKTALRWLPQTRALFTAVVNRHMRSLILGSRACALYSY